MDTILEDRLTDHSSLVLESRICNKCKLSKHLNYFHKGARKCKSCYSAYSKEYYSKNRVKKIAYSKTWSIANKVRSNLSKTNYARRNQKSNAVANKIWRLNNPERAREHVRSRRSKMSPIPVHVIQQRFSVFGNSCAYCGNDKVKLEVDHVIPLSKGGKHIPANIRPACRRCNGSKSSRKLSDWISDPNRMTGAS